MASAFPVRRESNGNPLPGEPPPADAHDELLALLSSPITKTRRRRPKPAAPKSAEVIPIRRIQGNWKREGRASRYEVAMAIDRLLQQGRVTIVDGRLRLGTWLQRFDAVSPQERWQRADEELQSYCQRMAVHETLSRRHVEDPSGDSQGSLFEAQLRRATPRPGVIKYVLRELREAGSLGYEELIAIIADRGGLEWVLQKTKRAYRSP